MDNIATVSDLIDYLQKNFKSTDKLCFWYEGGAYMNCEHLPKSLLGKSVLKTVKQDKEERLKCIDNDERFSSEIDKQYKTVKETDVIIY